MSTNYHEIDMNDLEIKGKKFVVKCLRHLYIYSSLHVLDNNNLVFIT